MPININDTNGIRTIEIARPDKANALLASDTVDIRDAVLEAPRDCRVLVFRGQGDKHFSAGMDLGTFDGASEDEAHATISNVGEMIRAVRLAPQASIAAVKGACIGAAFELVLAADLRVAHQSAKLGLPEVKLGIPSVVDAAQLHHFIGLSLAKEMLITGELKTVDEIASTGFANRIVESDQVDEAAHEWANHLVELPALAVREQRRLIDNWLNTPLQVAVDHSTSVFSGMFRSPSTREAIAAYATARR